MTITNGMRTSASEDKIPPESMKSVLDRITATEPKEEETEEKDDDVNDS